MSNNPVLSPLPDSPPREHEKIDSPAAAVETIPVTPPPTVASTVSEGRVSTSERNASFPASQLDFLCGLIGLSGEDDGAEVLALHDFLASQRCRSLEDVAFIQEQDFEDCQTPLHRAIQRKLLLIGKFLLQGGSLEEIGSMQELCQAMRTEVQAPPTAPVVTKSLDECIIRLDVGGYKFTTTKDTLCRVPDSLLGRMFSGRHQKPAPKDADGFYIIDRNGMYFHHILDFLRVGAVISLPSGAAAKEELAIEADFFGIEALVRAIRCPQIDVSECLSEETLSIRNDEDVLRKAFMDGSAKGFDQHRGLVSLYDPDTIDTTRQLKYEPLGEPSYDQILMDNLRKQARHGAPVIAQSLEEFQSNFNREHPNVLHRLAPIMSEEPVIIAGGAVLRALTSSNGLRTASLWGGKSDIDLFLYCQDRVEATRIARRIFYALAVDNEKWAIVRSRGVITMNNWVGTGWNIKVGVKVQIVLRLYDSPTEVLVGFDCDCCCCAYDGRSVWATPRCLGALKTGVNILNPLHSWPNKASYELRLGKYAHRGFPVVVPGLDKKRIDFDAIRRTPVRKLKGMARFLKVSFEMEALVAGVRCSEMPRQVQSLRSEALRSSSDADLLTSGALGGYFDDDGCVIVPRVYSTDDGVGTVFMWWDYVGGDYIPLARSCRGEAWHDIANAGVSLPQGSLPSLVEAWDMAKRSREYLNSDMDKYDLDNLYYNHAYTTDA